MPARLAKCSMSSSSSSTSSGARLTLARGGIGRYGTAEPLADTAQSLRRGPQSSRDIKQIVHPSINAVQVRLTNGRTGVTNGKACAVTNGVGVDGKRKGGPLRKPLNLRTLRVALVG